jgi:DNA-binding NarL/FixJ family response regulator
MTGGVEFGKLKVVKAEDLSFRLGAKMLRVLLAIASPLFRQTMQRVAQAALDLLPWPVTVETVEAPSELEERAGRDPRTLLLLDWEWAKEETPDLLSRMFDRNPQMRVVVLLPPGAPKAYRSALWAAGACASTPRDRLDEEWMVTILCLVRRAMEREGLLPAAPAQEAGAGEGEISASSRLSPVGP